MRRALWLVLACGGDATPSLIASGNLVAIKEGEQRTLELTGPATLDPGAPLGAMIDGGTLTLAPDCTTITGTSGPPRLFVLTLHTPGGVDVPLAVEVTPSAEGECRPTIWACVSQPGDTCASLGHASDCPMGDTLVKDTGRIPVNYVTPATAPFPDPAIPRQVVAFELVNPDPMDGLNALVLTDGPYKVHFGSATNACSQIDNVNRAGGFELDYRTGAGTDPSTPIVSSGVFELGVNREQRPEPYGLEVVSCASQGPGPDCEATPVADQVQWHIDEHGSNRDTTMQLRVWATPPPGNGNPLGYDVRVEAAWDVSPQSIELDDGNRIGSGVIHETASSTINTDPIVITAHLGQVNDQCLTIKATGSGAGSAGGSDYQATFTRSVLVGSGSSCN